MKHGNGTSPLSWKGCKPQDGGAMLQPASSVMYQAWTARAYFNLLRIFTHRHTYVYTLYLCMYIYIYRYLSIYLSVYLSIYLSVCGSNCSRVPIVPDSLCNLCMVNMWKRTTKYDNNTNNTQKNINKKVNRTNTLWKHHLSSIPSSHLTGFQPPYPDVYPAERTWLNKTYHVPI